MKNEVIYAGTKIKIEKGIAIPNQSSGRRGGMKQALKEMALGDSFAVPLEKYGNYRGIHALAGQAGVRITVRANQKDKTFRVWRIA